MKILAIGDLHGRPYNKYLTNIEKYDKIIFLGDYVDSFYLSDIEIIDNLKKLIQFKKDNLNKVELLIGNHDFQYMGYLRQADHCSGFRYSYSAELYKIFNDNKELFKVAYQYKNTLFTHAGLTADYFQQLSWSNLKNIINFEISENNTYADILNKILIVNPYSLWSIGSARGGYSFGSCLWADMTEFLSSINGRYTTKLASWHLLKNLSCVQGHQPVIEVIKLEDDNRQYIWCDCDSYETTEGKLLSKDKAYIELDI